MNATAWDRRIIYEVTGLKFHDEDYIDETSDDELNSDPTAILKRTKSLHDTVIMPELASGEPLLTGLQAVEDAE